MTLGIFQDARQRGSYRKSAAFHALVCTAAGSALAVFVWMAVAAAQMDLPRNALWEVVSNICVPGESLRHDPKPCVEVDLSRGVDSGFAILRDPRGGTQFLLIPTIRISGIESPIARGPNAYNYFGGAWESRVLLEDALHRKLARDKIGMAINSVVGRSQDQMHIHFSCIRPDVWLELHKNENILGNQWARFPPVLGARRYMAIWVPGEELGANNPIQLLAEKLPNALQNMRDRTLVVVGMTRANGAKGFVILAGQVDKDTGDLGNGEELLDNSCQVAQTGREDSF